VWPSSRWQVRRVLQQRARPDVVPFAPSASADRNTASVKVLTGPQRPLVWVPGRQQQQVWREPVLARTTATGGARRGW
jgi:hypothetical protein